MVELPRQSIDEVIAKYDFHPEVADVYVEGPFDRDFVFEFLDAIGARGDVSVYAIEDIDVPAEAVQACGLQQGSNKHRVLALARQIETRLPQVPSRVVCVVDADMDRLFNRLRAWAAVHHTDYTCMEMYILNENVIRKFLRFTCNLGEALASEFLTIASEILPTLFRVRAAIEALGLGVSPPSFDSGLSKKGDFSSFSSERYIQRFIDSNGLKKRSEEIKTLLLDLSFQLSKDLRQAAHGHDFIDLLFEFSWLRGGVKLHSKDVDVLKFGARIVASGVDYRHLAREPLFNRLSELAQKVHS